MQRKTLIACIVLTVTAFIMNITRFEYRYIIFPLLLIFFPLWVFRQFNYHEKMRFKREGLALFISLTAIILVTFPPCFFTYFMLFHKMSLTWPDSSSVLEALQKGLFLLLIVALPEEIFFRGLIQEELFKEKTNKVFLFITQKNLYTSLLFGFIHAISFLDISRAATFFPSLLFGWIVEKSGGSIMYATLFHAFSNSLVFVLWRFLI